MKEAGIAVIYISHRLREVTELADQVTVLRDGRLIETRPAAGISAADMIRLMVGRDLTEVFPKREVPIGDTVLEVRGLSRAGEFDDVALVGDAEKGLADFHGFGIRGGRRGRFTAVRGRRACGAACCG